MLILRRRSNAFRFLVKPLKEERVIGERLVLAVRKKNDHRNKAKQRKHIFEQFNHDVQYWIRGQKPPGSSIDAGRR